MAELGPGFATRTHPGVLQTAPGGLRRRIVERGLRMWR